MKNKKVIAVIAALTMAVLMIAPSTVMADDTYLVYGMENGDVAALQRALINAGYLYADATGYYGDLTYDAVARYQYDHQLYVDGEAGPQVFNSLYGQSSIPAASAPAASGSVDVNGGVYLVVGMTGGDVTAVQQALASMGYMTTPVDGYYGPYTSDSVYQFQVDHGLYADGEAGPQTLRALFGGGSSSSSSSSSSAPAASAPASVNYTGAYLKVGATGDIVKAVQNALTKLGYLDTPVDGYYGPYTAAAVEAYQRDKGLYADGETGSQTFGSLFGPSAGAASSSSSAPAAPLPANLSKDQIIAMQNKLISLGYMGAAADGTYGPWTSAAVKTYQGVHGSSADGVLTQALYDKIMAETKKFTPISSSSSYNDVVALQSALDQNRMVGAVDGWFGPQTDDAIRTIQKIFGLPQTGVADAKTMAYIYNYKDNIGINPDVSGYYSDTNYMIYIDSFRNQMNIYQGGIWNWNKIASWQCSTGASATPTTTGQFTANFKGWAFGDDSFTCYYFTSFNGPEYMHSTLYNSGTWVDQDKRLGLNISHGCVRLDTSNAQWIYNNIPLGTKVIVTR